MKTKEKLEMLRNLGPGVMVGVFFAKDPDGTLVEAANGKTTGGAWAEDWWFCNILEEDQTAKRLPVELGAKLLKGEL